MPLYLSPSCHVTLHARPRGAIPRSQEGQAPGPSLGCPHAPGCPLVTQELKSVLDTMEGTTSITMQRNRLMAWFETTGARGGQTRVKLDLLLGQELPERAVDLERLFASHNTEERELLRPSCSRLQVKFFRDKCAKHAGLR